jgi:glycosyltransferase involved in cell wall biosynthesis
MIDALLRTGEFSFYCLAGAIRHQDYRIQTVEPHGEKFRIHPVDGYGNPQIIRQVLESEKPDILWFMTDPRFYVWLWDMADEIRKNVPMIYYHVWDNYPFPTFNRLYYNSNDMVCTISKVTDDIVRTVSPDIPVTRIPHAVDTDIFKKDITSIGVSNIRKETNSDDKLLFFWNNRNARRKQSGTLMFWFKEFLDKVGHDNATLIMHTEPKDPNGQDLDRIIDNLNMGGKIFLSTQKVPAANLASFYNAADCTINIADAEGFGLATLESLACETPIIVNMTGGLQEQVTDGEQWFGFGIEPASKAIIGSQEVPWIYEDRASKEGFLDAMTSFYNLSKEERESMGKNGRSHVLKNYGMSTYAGQWYETMNKLYEDNGSWSTRKNYKAWELIQIQ